MVPFIETENTFVNGVCTVIAHKHRPWKKVSDKMAKPVIRDLDQTHRGHLTAAFMRVRDNSQFEFLAMLQIAQMAREARDGAGYSRTAVNRAARAMKVHERYGEFFNRFEPVFRAGYDELSEKC